MYTSNQLDCMQEMGIQLYKPKSAHEISRDSDFSTQSTASTGEQVADNQTASDVSLFDDATIKDLAALFPNVSPITGNKLKLSEDFNWLVEPKNTRIFATKSQLITAPLNQLSVAQKRDVWAVLQNKVSGDSTSK